MFHFCQFFLYSGERKYLYLKKILRRLACGYKYQSSDPPKFTKTFFNLYSQWDVRKCLLIVYYRISLLHWHRSQFIEWVTIKFLLGKNNAQKVAHEIVRIVLALIQLENAWTSGTSTWTFKKLHFSRHVLCPSSGSETWTLNRQLKNVSMAATPGY